jgi:hypothetical protein
MREMLVDGNEERLVRVDGVDGGVDESSVQCSCRPTARRTDDVRIGIPDNYLDEGYEYHLDHILISS